MCHELAHLSQRHYARSQNRSSPLANALMILGSIAVAAASRNPEAIVIAPAAMQQMSINYTRSNEKEADRIISKLPRMTPGKQRGRPVRVPFSVPITFKLQ